MRRRPGPPGYGQRLAPLVRGPPLLGNTVLRHPREYPDWGVAGATRVPPMSFRPSRGLPLDEGSAPCARSSFARSSHWTASCRRRVVRTRTPRAASARRLAEAGGRRRGRRGHRRLVRALRRDAARPQDVRDLRVVLADRRSRQPVHRADEQHGQVRGVPDPDVRSSGRTPPCWRATSPDAVRRLKTTEWRHQRRGSGDLAQTPSCGAISSTSTG